MTPAAAEAIARDFLRETAGRPEPWPVAFTSWATARGLGAREAQDVRREAIRLRVFHAAAVGVDAARGRP